MEVSDIESFMGRVMPTEAHAGLAESRSIMGEIIEDGVLFNEMAKALSVADQLFEIERERLANRTQSGV